MLKFLCMILAGFLCSGQLAATELKPWHGSIYSLNFNASVSLQQFEKLDTHCGVIKRPELDAFYNLGAHMVVKENITAEIEISALDSRHRLFGFQALRLTGRYFWLDDVIGDPVSIATGLTVSKIFHAARRNIAAFDHGGVACEGHIAIGKELSSCEQFWVSRAWGVLGLGIADIGYPWLRAKLAWEHNWWERHQFRVFADGIWGFGHHDLHIHPSFKGYGSVNYQAIEVGLRYGFRFDNDALVSLAYSFRVYGHNCPINANILQLEVCYPFGL